MISSPESSDSGIQSDDRLNRHSVQTNLKADESRNGEDSLYSSIISSKKSSENLIGELANLSKMDPNDSDESSSSIIHVEQHELPLGWIRCCGKSMKNLETFEKFKIIQVK